MGNLPHQEITEDILGAAMKVLNTLRPGLIEKPYERALIIELRKRGRRIDTQKEFDIFYEGHKVGTLRPDLIVDNAVIVDPKVVECFHDSHTAQLLGYLAITNLEVGLLLNFKYSRLKWKRLVR